MRVCMRACACAHKSGRVEVLLQFSVSVTFSWITQPISFRI